MQVDEVIADLLCEVDELVGRLQCVTDDLLYECVYVRYGGREILVIVVWKGMREHRDDAGEGLSLFFDVVLSLHFRQSVYVSRSLYTVAQGWRFRDVADVLQIVNCCGQVE